MKVEKGYFIAAIAFSFLAVLVAAKAAMDVGQVANGPGYPANQANYAVAGGSGGGCGSGGGGCGSGSGGGCGSGGAPTDPAELKRIEKQAVSYYISKKNDNSVKADVIDKGCHVEIAILKGEKVVMYLSYRNGQLQELS